MARLQPEEEDSGLDVGHASPAPLPFRILLDALWLQWRVVSLPWQALVFSLSCCTQLLARFLTAVGAPPVAYRDKMKLKEAQKIVEHLHQREDGFRRKLKELTAALEQKSRETRRLELKLSKAKQELIHAPSAETDRSLSKPEVVPERSSLLTHFYFLFVGLLPTFWLLQQPAVPAVSRKFAWSLILPEGLVYFFYLVGSGPSSARAILQCCSLFMAGFAFSHWLHAHC